MTEVLTLAEPRERQDGFGDAIAQKFQGLAERGVYEIVCRQDVPDGANVLGGRFVVEIKDKGTKEEQYKLRFVVQKHTSTEKNIVVHNTTTLAQSSVKMLVAVAAIFGIRLW